MSKRFAFVFDIEKERSMFQDFVKCICDGNISKNVKGCIVTHRNDYIYFLLESEVEMHTRGVSLDDFFYMSKQGLEQDAYQTLRVCQFARTKDEYNKIILSE